MKLPTGRRTLCRIERDLAGSPDFQLLEVRHRILPPGEAVVYIDGELDLATADRAAQYVEQVIDGHRGPVIINVGALRFCDATGLHTLLRMARYAEQADCPFQLAALSPSLVKLLRITGLHGRFRQRSDDVSNCHEPPEYLARDVSPPSCRTQPQVRVAVARPPAR